VNRLLRDNAAARVEEDVGEQAQLVEGVSERVRLYKARVEIAIRHEAKQGFKKKPKGDDIQLLQVRALERLATGVEGILDLLRFKVCSIVILFSYLFAIVSLSF
jgi:hypothetical protein